MTTLLRMPRGLWEDLEHTIIQQDRQFLTEVARSLGLSVAEVIRRCMGTAGSPQAALLAPDTLDPCPWHDLLGDGLWRPCTRQRLRPAGPCQFHEQPGPNSSLDVGDIGTVYPYRYNGRIYWTADNDNDNDNDPDPVVFREDGTMETEFRIVFFTDAAGERQPIIVRKTEG